MRSSLIQHKQPHRATRRLLLRFGRCRSVCHRMRCWLNLRCWRTIGSWTSSTHLTAKQGTGRDAPQCDAQRASPAFHDECTLSSVRFRLAQQDCKDQLKKARFSHFRYVAWRWAPCHARRPRSPRRLLHAPGTDAECCGCSKLLLTSRTSWN
jgi:hypothetical protein